VRGGKEGLAILYGPAGTGKTTLLKKLIQENPKKEFILINSKDLENPDSEGYLEYFLENKNRIFILEDCEKLLLSRNQGGGSNQLVTILNMADGLLGSTLKTKFICTFNTDLRNIDEALLRKGRMRLKYYVGPLCLEKTRILANDVTIQKEMTLAEIYNQEENDFSKTSQKRIGF
jgi:SpoVK/Ycf46/Vps4 family AAA+-type ATPase